MAINAAVSAAANDPQVLSFEPENGSITIFKTDGHSLRLVKRGREAEQSQVLAEDARRSVSNYGALRQIIGAGSSFNSFRNGVAYSMRPVMVRWSHDASRNTSSAMYSIGSLSSASLTAL